MIHRAILMILLASVALAAPLGADELDDFRARLQEATKEFKDLKATVVVLESNRRELEKMGKVFAETYEFKKASVQFMSPNCLKVNGELGMMKVEFVTAGNTRILRIPSVRYKTKEDITGEPEKQISSLDVGVVSDGIWGIYNVKLVRTEKSESGSTVYVLHLQTAKSQKYQMIWVDECGMKLLRRDRLFDDGSLKVKAVYSKHTQVNGIWIPTHAEIYNGDGKLAATTEMKDIKTNAGLTNGEFS